MDMILGLCIFQNRFTYFLVTYMYVVGTHWNCIIDAFQCAPTT